MTNWNNWKKTQLLEPLGPMTKEEIIIAGSITTDLSKMYSKIMIDKTKCPIHNTDPLAEYNQTAHLPKDITEQSYFKELREEKNRTENEITFDFVCSIINKKQ